MADTKEADRERKEPAKKGLHGWKAAAAMFGCGTFAALGVFGVLVGGLNLFVSTVSSGVSEGDQPAPIADQSVAPREEFLDDRFDLCGRTLPSIRELNLTFVSEEGAYQDTSIDGGDPGDDDLVRSDQCSGQVAPAGAYTVPWEFDFSYRAIIYAPDDDREEIAATDLAELQGEVDGSEVVVNDSGGEDLGDESYYYYGSLDDNQESSYTIVVMQRSATYTIRLSSADDISLESFAGEARKFGPQLEITLGNRIPE